MKLPGPFNHLFHSKSESKEILISLVLAKDSVGASVWQMEMNAEPRVFATKVVPVADDTWKARTEAADHAIISLDETIKTTFIHRVVLGLPAYYLTPEGDIDPTVRPHLKRLLHELNLQAVGFVSLPQSLLYRLKQEEGVPPTVILLGVTQKQMTVSLYKVGVLTGQTTFDLTEPIVSPLEETLKAFPNVEVLPTRMLLYGLDEAFLERIKGEILHHPWPTRVNFLHFPKIEITSPASLMEAITLGGASELGGLSEVATAEDAGGEFPEHMAEEPSEQTETSRETADANVTFVDPKDLGFEEIVHDDADPENGEDAEETDGYDAVTVVHQERIPGSDRHGIHEAFEEEEGKEKPVLSLPNFWRKGYVFIFVVVVLLIGVGALYWFLPHATISILLLPKALSQTVTVTVDPKATVASPQDTVIQGFAQEKTVTGEKSQAVTGKKEIGDPARGVVTIYNKSSVVKTFSKGTKLTASSLVFTLDDTVSIASASENAEYTVTPGKATAGITAQAIGTKGNVAAGTEFAITDISSAVAVARNEAALSGGTSKEVTVVSRADYDALVKALTDELLGKAKTELGDSVSGNEKLIDATIKTTVKDKSFIEELDQQATEVHGKLTISVSGISYRTEDVSQLLKDSLKTNVPSGFDLVLDQSHSTVESTQIKKDGTISLKVTFEGIAVPGIDTKRIRNDISGKTVPRVTRYLQNLPGIAGVEFVFAWWPWKNQLPLNPRNITIQTKVQE